MTDLIPNLDKLTREQLIECRTAVDRLLYLPPDWPRYLKYRTAFRELLAMALEIYWGREPEATELRVSATRLIHLFMLDINTEKIARCMNFSQIDRFLKELEAEGFCRLESAGLPYNVWLFPKATAQDKRTI